MQLGNILDVAIGLFFTFLVLSLIGTSVNEAFASAIRWRGRLLRGGLRKLLSDGANGPAALFERVFGHGLVQTLSNAGLPSYVPSSSFSLALFDALSDKGDGTLFSQIERGVATLPEGLARQSLVAMIVDARGDQEALRARVEKWFENAMDRLSGMYKRRVQLVHFVFGFVVALMFNVDSINIAQVLWHSADKRAAIALQAQAFTAAHAGISAGAAPDAAQTLQQLGALPVPIGWSGVSLSREPIAWGYAIIGWLVTGFAVSLGAPFWFDLLQNLMNINVRGSGPKPGAK